MVALAAKRHSVPFVVLVGLHKLSPLFPHDPDVTYNGERTCACSLAACSLLWLQQLAGHGLQWWGFLGHQVQAGRRGAGCSGICARTYCWLVVSLCVKHVLAAQSRVQVHSCCPFGGNHSRQLGASKLPLHNPRVHALLSALQTFSRLAPWWTLMCWQSHLCVRRAQQLRAWG